jgi:hypothetical protein
MARQALVTRVTSPPILQVVFNEAILRRPIGGHDVMARQLQRLAAAAELPSVSIRVVPFDTGLHHGVMSGPFEILRFPLHSNGQATEPPVVYVESFTGALYLTSPARSTAMTPPSPTFGKRLWTSELLGS